MPALTREDSKRLDESFLETLDTRQHRESEGKRDMHIVYAEIKEEMRQRDCNREKEMRLLVEKISDIPSVLIDRKLEINLHPLKTDKDHSMLPDQEVTLTKEKANEKVSWDKKEKNSKEEGSKI